MSQLRLLRKDSPTYIPSPSTAQKNVRQSAARLEKGSMHGPETNFLTNSGLFFPALTLQPLSSLAQGLQKTMRCHILRISIPKSQRKLRRSIRVVSATEAFTKYLNAVP